MIKSFYTDQAELISSLKKLYNIERFDLDATFNTGTMHGKDIPKICCDIDPASIDVTRADCRDLEFISSGSIDSMMFDPPFLAGGGGGGKISSKYGSFATVSEMLEMYYDSLKESLRILSKGGLLVFKCQDLMNGRVQTFSHCEIYNMALSLGFYARDIFILISNKRMKPPNMKKQLHSRKYHSYFWVFEKCNKRNKTII